MNRIIWAMPQFVHEAILKIFRIRLVCKYDVDTGKTLAFFWCKDNEWPLGG